MKKDQEYKDLLQYFQYKYPIAFSHEIRPLSLGIHNEILKLEKSRFSEKQIYEFLYIYTRSEKYISALKANSIRVGLNGNEES